MPQSGAHAEDKHTNSVVGRSLIGVVAEDTHAEGCLVEMRLFSGDEMWFKWGRIASGSALICMSLLMHTG
jgi:hypothetical protein